jgi:hypothetical protein
MISCSGLMIGRDIYKIRSWRMVVKLKKKIVSVVMGE